MICTQAEQEKKKQSQKTCARAGGCSLRPAAGPVSPSRWGDGVGGSGGAGGAGGSSRRCHGALCARGAPPPARPRCPRARQLPPLPAARPRPRPPPASAHRARPPVVVGPALPALWEWPAAPTAAPKFLFVSGKRRGGELKKRRRAAWAAAPERRESRLGGEKDSLGAAEAIQEINLQVGD